MSRSASARTSSAAAEDGKATLEYACRVDLPVRVSLVRGGSRQEIEAVLRRVDSSQLELQLIDAVHAHRGGPSNVRIYLPGLSGADRLLDGTGAGDSGVERCILVDYDLAAHPWLPDQLFSTTDQLTPAALTKAGLPIRSVREGVTFRAAVTEEELRLVRQLCERTHRAVGQPPGTPADRWGDDALILAAWRGRRPVAALRLNLLSDWDSSELATYARLPSGLPESHQVVEMGRVCTDPAYRGTPLLTELFTACANVVGCTGRGFVIGCATADVLAGYRRIGAQVIGSSYVHPVGAQPYDIFLFDINELFFGFRVNPVVWKVVYSDAARTATKMGHGPRTLRTQLTWRAYRIGSPLWSLLARRRQ